MLEAIVLDDHHLVAQVIAGLLSEVAGVEVLAICTCVPKAIARIRQHTPQLLVLDVNVSGGHYLDAVRVLHALNPEAKLLFVTYQAALFQPPPPFADCTIGVVDKALAWDELLLVLQHWQQTQPLTQLLHKSSCVNALLQIRQLSPREHRLLLQLGQGQLNKQIAVNLGLTATTVETYRKGIAAKLGVSGSELVRLATLYRCLGWRRPAISPECAYPCTTAHQCTVPGVTRRRRLRRPNTLLRLGLACRRVDAPLMDPQPSAGPDSPGAG